MLKCFGMYNNMKEATSSSEQDIDTNIVTYMTTNNIDYNSLISNYKSIQYNENNICKYIDCILYLNYDRTDEFIDYIFNEYVLKCQLFEHIQHFDIIKDKINNICDNENELSDDILIYFNIWDNENENELADNILIYLNKYVNITSLNASKNYKITDESIKCLTNLTNLNANDNTKITDKSVKCLINLTTLDASGNYEITDESVKCLINLTTLNANDNNKITDESVKCLINLTTLNACSNSKITDESVKHLTNVTSLYAKYNSKIKYNLMKN